MVRLASAATVSRFSFAAVVSMCAGVKTLSRNCAGNPAPLIAMSLGRRVFYPLSYPISSRRSASRTTSLAGTYRYWTDQTLSNGAPLA